MMLDITVLYPASGEYEGLQHTGMNQVRFWPAPHCSGLQVPKQSGVEPMKFDRNSVENSSESPPRAQSNQEDRMGITLIFVGLALLAGMLLVFCLGPFTHR